MIPNAINNPPINGKILICLNMCLSKEALKYLNELIKDGLDAKNFLNDIDNYLLQAQ